MPFLLVVQILVSLVLAAAILLQAKGTGLGSTWGGVSSASYRSKRGAEKVLFTTTIILGVVFLGLSVLSLR